MTIYDYLKNPIKPKYELFQRVNHCPVDFRICTGTIVQIGIVDPNLLSGLDDGKDECYIAYYVTSANGTFGFREDEIWPLAEEDKEFDKWWNNQFLARMMPNAGQQNVNVKLPTCYL